MMRLSNVTKSFGGIKALDSCTLEIKKGAITAIIGPNGSGKTTLFDVISQIIKVDSGKITFRKTDITKMQKYAVARQGISRTFQDPRLFKNLTINDHLDIALSEEYESLIKSILMKKKSDTDTIKKILKTVGLEKNGETIVSELSYGQKKLIALAIALAKPHTCIMLDEPVAGINPELRKKIKKILQQLKRKETIILIEHDMNFVMDLADEIYVLDHGELIAHGTPRQIRKNKRVLEAYLGD
jgi:ABC-type branched-subunit amino acid transport system ATPase component